MQLISCVFVGRERRSAAAVQDSACEVRRLMILWKKAAEGREARPPSNYNMDMILTAM